VLRTLETNAVNLLKLLRDGDMSQNYLLHDGDAVYLAPNGRVDIGKDILPFINLAYQIADMKDD
jgi:polysaccharide export outer membrane protein